MKTIIETTCFRKKSFQLLFILIAAVMFSLFPFFNSACYPASHTTASCIPNFPDRDGWYGGDGAYSILLDDARTLWLFGDSFASAREGKLNRVGMDLILGTTLAISTCSKKGKFDIRYFLKKKNGRFVSYFGDGQWMWPQDPFQANGILYIPLAVIEPAPEIAGPFKFRITGYKIAEIRNYRLPNPLNWSVEYLDWSAAVPPDIAALAPTSVICGKYVYFYSFSVPSPIDTGAMGNILIRIETKRLHEPAEAMEYYAKDKTWQKGLYPANAKIVLDAAASELSVRYHKDKKKWIAVYLSVQDKGKQMLYMEAEKLEGPWSAPKTLLKSIPEVNPADRKYNRDNFCYAGKEHIQFAKKEKLVTTYVCNSLEDLDTGSNFIRSNLFLYRPIVNEVLY